MRSATEIQVWWAQNWLLSVTFVKSRPVSTKFLITVWNCSSNTWRKIWMRFSIQKFHPCSFQIQAFMYGWLTFYHQVRPNNLVVWPLYWPAMNNTCVPLRGMKWQRISSRIWPTCRSACKTWEFPQQQNLANGYQAVTHQTRENFKASRDDIQSLMRRMLEVRQTVRSSMIHHPSSSFLIAES